MRTRTMVSSTRVCDYRYGFNSMEKDDEIKGKGNSYDFGARMYDSRLGRWLTIDSYFSKYPDLSPYNYTANNPIYYIDPDGKRIIIANESQQATALNYMKEQFGVDMFKFNKRGELLLSKKIYNAAKGNFKPEQQDIADGLIKVMNDKKILEVQIYSDENINFSRNPIVPFDVVDPKTGRTNQVYGEKYGSIDITPELIVSLVLVGADWKGFIESNTEQKRGFVMPKLSIEGITLLVDPKDERAFVLINQKKSQTSTFEADGGGVTTPCESCIVIHEILDHGLDYINTGTLNEPPGATKKDNVQFLNKALKNVGSKESTGNDHNDKP